MLGAHTSNLTYTLKPQKVDPHLAEALNFLTHKDVAGESEIFVSWGRWLRLLFGLTLPGSALGLRANAYSDEGRSPNS